MSAALPDPDEHADLRAALRCDAARVTEPPFDAALHAATMRRMRALASPADHRFGFAWRWALGAGLAMLVLGAASRFRPVEQKRPVHTRGGGGSPFAVVVPAPRGSLLAYQRAMAHGDAAVIAMLDLDAATPSLLTAPAFARGAGPSDFHRSDDE